MSSQTALPGLPPPSLTGVQTGRAGRPTAGGQVISLAQARPRAGRRIGAAGADEARGQVLLFLGVRYERLAS